MPCSVKVSIAAKDYNMLHITERAQVFREVRLDVSFILVQT